MKGIFGRNQLPNIFYAATGEKLTEIACADIIYSKEASGEPMRIVMHMSFNDLITDLYVDGPRLHYF